MTSKSDKRDEKKLTLRLESLRILTTTDLAHVSGGAGSDSVTLSFATKP